MPDTHPQAEALFLLTETARRFREAFEASLACNPAGLTPAAIRTLGHVIRSPGSRQNVLAERMEIEPMSLSSHINRLRKDGYVTQSCDPLDRRAKLVHPTDKAIQLMIELDPGFDALYQTTTRGLSKEEMTLLAAGLAKMRANIATDPSLTQPFTLIPKTEGKQAS
ncbi:MarR family winged helix-turn-helix transcriptional regulator [Aureimonas sp. D3]|uniref:MarR family winged helix-turn-helix transcriptional regulator n=1 Tax=Aureimonas sp. D3 TaxID=1638164 RepID=UPI000781D939|nr:MarR family winged helix-turn-helix transcriptional regulator [Aureimonas sp. D3]